MTRKGKTKNEIAKFSTSALTGPKTAGQPYGVGPDKKQIIGDVMCWLNNLLDRKEFWAILGTVLGFSLNEGSRVFREWREKGKLKIGIYDELKANLYQIEHKKDTVRSMIKALKKQGILPGTSVPCATMMYSNHFSSIIKNLKGIERDNIENIYSRLKIDDEFINGPITEKQVLV